MMSMILKQPCFSLLTKRVVATLILSLGFYSFLPLSLHAVDGEETSDPHLPDLIYQAWDDEEPSANGYWERREPLKKIDSREINGRSFSEQMLLSDENLYLFLSHPKLLEHYTEGTEKIENFYRSWKAEWEKAPELLPQDLPISALDDYISTRFSSFKKAIPFLIYGIADTSSIGDETTLALVKALQIKIFKQWLSQYQIGTGDPDLMSELVALCTTNRWNFLTDQVLPFLDKQESREDSYDDFLDDYPEADFDDYRNLFIWHEQEMSPEEQRKMESFKNQEQRHKEIVEQYFSRDAILSLFLDLMGA